MFPPRQTAQFARDEAAALAHGYDRDALLKGGQAIGATFGLPEKDRYGFGRRYLRDTMQVLCGGRIAEKRKTGDISSGAAMDIEQATQFARHMILEWGMSERLGFVYYGGSESRDVFIAEREYSDDTARIIDEEIKRIIEEAEAKARRSTIQQEADFYGAMDGASKFVRGDAIAGLIITTEASVFERPEDKKDGGGGMPPGGMGGGMGGMGGMDMM